MKMQVAKYNPTVTLTKFLEIVIMWHTHGDIPMDRVATQMFIEDEAFVAFLDSVKNWSRMFGLTCPTKSDVVRTLHSLYDAPRS